MSRFSIFCQNFFFSNAEKFRRGTLLCSRKVLVSKIVRDKRGGKYHNSPSKFLCFTVPKIFIGEPFSVSQISGIRKFWIRWGREYRDFPSKFLSHCTETFHWRTLCSFRKNSFIENFHA